MLQCPDAKRWLCAMSLLGAICLASTGCQTWRSAAIPGMASKQGEREVLKQAKQDPFPSPSDVGMTVTK